MIHNKYKGVFHVIIDMHGIPSFIFRRNIFYCKNIPEHLEKVSTNKISFQIISESGFFSSTRQKFVNTVIFS